VNNILIKHSVISVSLCEFVLNTTEQKLHIVPSLTSSPSLSVCALITYRLISRFMILCGYKKIARNLHSCGGFLSLILLTYFSKYVCNNQDSVQVSQYKPLPARLSADWSELCVLPGSDLMYEVNSSHWTHFVYPTWREKKYFVNILLKTILFFQ